MTTKATFNVNYDYDDYELDVDIFFRKKKDSFYIKDIIVLKDVDNLLAQIDRPIMYKGMEFHKDRRGNLSVHIFDKDESYKFLLSEINL